MVDEVEGLPAAQLGRNIRDFGALPELLGMLNRHDTRQDALRVIGNLASDAVDVNARETKQMLYELRGFEQVIPHIWCAASLAPLAFSRTSVSLAPSRQDASRPHL